MTDVFGPFVEPIIKNVINRKFKMTLKVLLKKC